MILMASILESMINFSPGVSLFSISQTSFVLLVFYKLYFPARTLTLWG